MCVGRSWFTCIANGYVMQAVFATHLIYLSGMRVLQAYSTLYSSQACKAVCQADCDRPMRACKKGPRGQLQVCALDESAQAQVYPPGHPIDPSFRDGLRGPEYAKPVTIGSDVWVGGGAIILGMSRFRVQVWPLTPLHVPLHCPRHAKRPKIRIS